MGDGDETWNSVYYTCNRIEPAHIRLTVDAPFALVTNVDKTSEQIYEGESDSITLVGGYIKKTDDTVIMDILPLNMSVTEEQKVETLKKEYRKICDTMEAYGLDKTLVANRKIILTSYDLASNGTGGDVAIFSDYILTSDGSLGIFSNFTKSLIMERNKSALSMLIGGMGLEETPEATLESWSFFTDIPREELSDTEKQFVDLITSAQKSGEGEQFVQEVAAFLLSEHKENDEENFWEELSKRYGTT